MHIVQICMKTYIHKKEKRKRKKAKQSKAKKGEKKKRKRKKDGRKERKEKKEIPAPCCGHRGGGGLERRETAIGGATRPLKNTLARGRTDGQQTVRVGEERLASDTRHKRRCKACALIITM